MVADPIPTVAGSTYQSPTAKRHIRDATLVCVDCVEVERALRAIRISEHYCSFDQTMLLTSLDTDYTRKIAIAPITCAEAYSHFMIKKLWQYVETPYCLVIQHDGFVLNPDAWDDAWYCYDYIGGNHFISGPNDDDYGGNGGFSWRSRRLLQTCGGLIPDEDCHGEDEAISRWYVDKLVQVGMKIATRKVQEDFSVENILWKGSFGHHHADLATWKDAPLFFP